MESPYGEWPSSAPRASHGEVLLAVEPLEEMQHDELPTAERRATSNEQSISSRHAAPLSARDLADELVTPARVAALAENDKAPTQYDPYSFTSALNKLPHFAITVARPVLVTMLWTIGWCTYMELSPSHRDHIEELQEFASPLLVVVSFLLVFRLSRVAVRDWDARSSIGLVVEMCRVLSSDTCVLCAECPAQRERLLRWTVALPVAVKNHLRGPLTRAEILHGNCDRRQELVPVLRDTHVDDVLESKFPPLHVLNQLRAAALDATLCSSVGEPVLRAVAYRGLCESINRMTNAWGVMEKINGTPLPFAYVALLRSFLLIYLSLQVDEPTCLSEPLGALRMISLSPSDDF